MRTLAILAEQAAAPPDSGAGSAVLRFLGAHPLAVGIAFIFLVAMVAAFVAARRRDRCLKAFRGFDVTLTDQTGRRIWGRLKVFSPGLELEYEAPFGEPAKRSFLLYEGDLARLLTLCRFTDRLSEANARRRSRQARRLARPPLVSRVRRGARNVVGTFRDAFVKAMGATVQHATQAAPSPVLTAQGGQMNAIGSILIGETANAYEPMIEQYVGRPVFLEVANPADPDAGVTEYHGHLGEYSAQFVLLVGVHRRFTESVPIDGQAHRLLEGTVEVRTERQTVRVGNGSAVAVTVAGMTAGDAGRDAPVTVSPGETAEVAVASGAGGAPAAVTLACERTFDLIVPRSVGLIRHASETAEA